MSNQSSEKPAKKRLLSYSKDNFPLYTIWFKDFFNVHNQTYEFISRNIENYYKKFDEIFFEWINQPKNRLKFMFEIKKEFMAIAEEILLQEIMLEQYKKTAVCFIIGPLQKYLEFVANDDSPIDRDIDMFSDNESDNQSSEEKQIIQNYVDETKLDDNYYLSFFK
jgi:hypothetical protein